MQKRQKRFQVLEERAVNKDGFIKEWEEVGLVAMDSKNDPAPSIKIENGMIVEMDGVPCADFSMIDSFIASHCIDVEVAPKAMAIDSLEYARMLVDINVPGADIKKLVPGLTPAKILDILKKMNVVELMMAMQKLRCRRTPANQAHITNVKDHPRPSGRRCCRRVLPWVPGT